MVDTCVLPIAFAFLEPALLLGLPAVLIPLIIHLLSRRRHVEMDWAAMEFVLAALAVERRRILLREYLLLFLRMLAIGLLILAAARPVVETPVSAIGYRAATAWVFVLDDSLSMCQLSRGESCFARAKEVIRQIVENAGPGDTFCLLMGAHPAVWRVELAVGDRQSFLRIVDEIRCRHTRNDWPACLQAVLKRLQRLRQELPQVTRVVVIVLTDGQRHTWEQALQTEQSELAKIIEQIANNGELLLCRIEGDSQANSTISRLEASPTVCVRNEEILFSGRVRFFGSPAPMPERVQWLIDGVKIGEVPLHAISPEEAAFAWSYRPTSGGDHVVEAIIPQDPLRVDNQRRVVISVRDRVRILCIDGQYSSIPFQGACDYVRLGLVPETTGVDGAPTQVKVIPEGRLAEIDIADIDGMFLCNVAQITRGEAEVLHEFLQQGGGLVIFTGPRVRPEAYNLLTEKLYGDEKSLFPGRFEGVVKQGDVKVGTLDTRHPLLQVFAGGADGGLQNIPVNTYLKFKPFSEQSCDVIARYSTDHPFIVTWSYGQGRVVLVTTSADMSWSSLPVWPSWVPLIQEIKAWVLGGKISARTLVCGLPLSLSFTAEKAHAAPRITVFNPVGETRRELAHLGNGEWQWVFQQTDWTGVYRVQIETNETNIQSSLFAVNPPLEESNLQTDGWEELMASELRGARVVSQQSIIHALEKPGRLPRGGTALSRTILVCLLGIIAVEILITHLRKSQ